MASPILLRAFVVAAVVVLTCADFEAINFLPGSTPCTAKLATSVPVDCVGKVAADQKYDVWKTSLDFRFGLISEAQWESLRQQYTSPWAGPAILRGSTPLFEPYDATKHYSLMEFLPITIRCLCGFNFVEEDEPLPANQPLPPEPPAAPHLYNKSILVPNCWATVYETLRTIEQCRGDDTSVFHDVFSTDDKDAQVWMEAATTVVPGAYAEATRNFGDVMFIFLRDVEMKRAILEHAVVFVDQDVVFEKAGTGHKNPYRLIDLATVEKEWKPSTQGGMFEWQLRRPNFGADQLKPFAERFSLFATKPDERWLQFWRWPTYLRKRYALGVADNPRKPGEVDGLTIMKARRYMLRKSSSDGWDMARMGGIQTQALLV